MAEQPAEIHPHAITTPTQLIRVQGKSGNKNRKPQHGGQH